MAYQPPHDLQLVYDPSKGFCQLVLYSEPPGIGPGIAFNSGKILTVHKTDDGRAVTTGSPYVEEWLQRLEPCEPDASHVALVGSKDGAALWQPCVYDDPQSPVSIAGDGCVCWQTFRDPVTWMPVAANHFRTVSGNHENWRYHTCSPLGLPEGERLASLIIESTEIWMRTENGTLFFLPEAQGAGYGSGYGGGGPTELARMIDKIVQQDGYDIAPGTPAGMPNRRVLAWVSSPAAKHRQELSLDQLKLLSSTGRIA
jgi:hypothetical protein